MRRRRWWAPLAAACLALLVLQASSVGRGVPMPAADAAAHRAGGGGSRVVATAVFNAAAGVARCKKQSHDKAGGAAPAACLGLADDARAVPTGANPLHNR